MFEPDGCYECGDEFHYDDIGGYNPPCPCGCGRCRSCCRAESDQDNDDWQDYELGPGDRGEWEEGIG